MPEQLQDDEPTIGRLVHDASRDVSALVKKEIQLAKSELQVSVKAGGLGIGLFAAAAFLVLLAIVMFSISLAYLIHWNGDGLDLQWAYLCVFGLYVAGRRAAGLHRRPLGQEGPRSRARDPPGAGDQGGADRRA